jgi:ADP-heptose:LPS heptosyltransferase
MARSAQLQADRGNPRLKFLDRYVGIPLVAALGLARRFRGRRPVPDGWRSVGLLVTSGIGDTVVATGVMRDLRAARPGARIVLFVTANNASFAKTLTLPDEVVELPVRHVPTAVRMVRERDLDVVVDLASWRRYDAVLAFLSGARSTVGRRTPGQHRDAAYDVAVDHHRDHELDNDRRLVAALGLDADELVSVPLLTLPEGATRPCDAPYVVFHLWPGGANFAPRSWPVERWEALGAAMHDRGLEVVLTGGPGDVDVNDRLARRWRSAGVPTRSVAGGDWDDTFRWLGFATGVVSVNTGIMHVAAALGAPTLALNGPTSASRWAPLGPFTRCVSSPIVPDGYLDLGFESDSRYVDAMRAITVDSVLVAWDELRADAGKTGR